MQILPAIDLRGGQCVRLLQGDFAQETVFDADPLAVARRWVEQGAPALHVVDLDGAKAGHPIHAALIQMIVKVARVPVQAGGGLRTDEHVRELLGAGAARVVLGTRALLDPQWCREVCETHPGKILLGLDAREEKLATHGWLEATDADPVEAAHQVARWPIAGIVYTDIARDGMMQGPNLHAYKRLTGAVTTPVYASGGVTTVANVRELARIGVAGCVIGRALYEGRLSLPAALTAARES